MNKVLKLKPPFIYRYFSIFMFTEITVFRDLVFLAIKGNQCLRRCMIWTTCALNHFCFFLLFFNSISDYICLICRWSVKYANSMQLVATVCICVFLAMSKIVLSAIREFSSLVVCRSNQMSQSCNIQIELHYHLSTYTKLHKNYKSLLLHENDFLLPKMRPNKWIELAADLKTTVE